MRPPQGHLALTVGKLGSVKIAGALSDGTKVSGSAKLLDGLNAGGWLCIALHKPLYSKKGFIGGLLWLDPDGGTLRVDTEYGWSVDWQCDDTKKEIKFARELDILGGYFGTGKDIPLGPAVVRYMRFSADVPAADLPPAAALTGGAWMSAAFPDIPATVTSGTITLAPADKPVKPAKGEPQEYTYAGDNPSAAKLTYAPKTGHFKGTFKLYYDGTNDKGALQHKTATVTYSGVMVPDGSGTRTGLGIGTTTVGKKKFGIPVFLSE